jgi:hypothetical protein
VPEANWLLEPCNGAQTAGQTIGNFATKYGGLVSQAGLAGQTAAFGAALTGIRSGNLGLVYGAVRTLPLAAQATFYGGAVSIGGSILSAAAGSGKDAASNLIAISLTSKLPEGFIKDAISEGVSQLAGAVIPDIKSCR